jgi:deoxyhypusine synthase
METQMKRSMFNHAPDVIPVRLKKGMSVPELVTAMGSSCFEARNVYKGAALFKRMIDEGDTIWLGIAGAGIAGGMGGMVISLLEAGFVDVVCSTGAQVYHDLHFAFGLPVKAIGPHWDDDKLREHGDTRIYDVGIRAKETLEMQDQIIRRFVKESYDILSKRPLSSWEFNYHLGDWTSRTARYPERSFTATAARLGVPVFWDSLSNHSIGMNLVRTDREGFPLVISAQKDIFDSASLVYSAGSCGFVELGGGGPKNFIQQTGPTVSQILGVEFEGAERGLQIGTAIEKEGSLSGCTFSESVTWGKYRSADMEKLVQIWGEYSVIFPMVTAYVLDLCKERRPRRLTSEMSGFIQTLKGAL